MKPTSIIFLVIALLLGIGGYTCIKIGQSQAVSMGIDLLEGTVAKEEDYIFSYDYSDDEIGKIAINLKDADVNIIGGSKKPYVELVNFAEGMYEFSASNRNITLSNNSDFSQIADMTSLVFNFKGLRSLVNYYNIRGREKTVNIYITDDCPVKIVECKLSSGNVHISSNSSQTDYNVTIENGDLLLADITTGSAANISIINGDLTFDNCSISNVSIEIDKGNSELITSYAYTLTAKLGTGDFSMGFRDELAYVNLNLFSGLGNVKLNGESMGGFYEVSDLPTSTKFDISIGKGDISINSNMRSESIDEIED